MPVMCWRRQSECFSLYSNMYVQHVTILCCPKPINHKQQSVWNEFDQIKLFSYLCWKRTSLFIQFNVWLAIRKYLVASLMINLLIQYLLALSCKRNTLSALSNCCLVNDCLFSMTLALIMLDMRHISLSVPLHISLQWLWLKPLCASLLLYLCLPQRVLVLLFSFLLSLQRGFQCSLYVIHEDDE